MLETRLVGGVYHPSERVNRYEMHTSSSTSESELGYAIHTSISSVRGSRGDEIHPAEAAIHTPEVSYSSRSGMKIIQRSEKETEERHGETQPQKESIAASSRSPDGSPMSSQEDEAAQEAHSDLMALRVEYTTLSHQLALLDVNKQAGQWARLYKQVKAAEARLRQAEQDTPPSPAESPEYAKQPEVHSSDEETSPPFAECTGTDERQEQLRTIASDLLYWKGGLNVLRQAQLPTWRGCFKWQIEAQIASLQTEYARLRAEAAKPDA